MRFHKITITTAEAVAAVPKQVTTAELEWSRKLWLDYISSGEALSDDFIFNMTVIISAAFVAGRTQGIRCERAKTKAKQANTPT